MNTKQIFKILIIATTALLSTATATLRFGSPSSTIKLTDGTRLVLINSLVNDGGTIYESDGSFILLEEAFFQNNAIYETDIASLALTGVYNPTFGQGVLGLPGSTSAINPQICRAEAGMEIQELRVVGINNRLEGMPSFNTPVELQNATTTLTVAINSVLNQNIKLNGGTLILEDDLTLADGVYIEGPGIIELNNRRLAFGSEDLTIGDSLYWKGAADIFFNGKIDLTGSWTFEGDCYLNGDSVALNLIGDASLTINNDSKLFVKQLKIGGLGNGPGNGKIYFEDESEVSSSELHLRRAALDFTTTYSFEAGHVIIEQGASDFITKDKIVYFNRNANASSAPSGRLTVDQVFLYYKTRTFAAADDPGNIRGLYNFEPVSDFNDSNSPIKIIEPGSIVHYGTFKTYQSSIISNFTDGMTKNIWLGSNTKAYIYPVTGNDPPVINGNNWFIHFAQDLDDLLFVGGGDSGATNATFENIVLTDFNPRHIVLQDDSTIVLGNNVVLELSKDIRMRNSDELTVTWTFEGDSRISGKGKIIDLNEGGFEIKNNATLTIQDVILVNVKNDSIKLDDNTKVIFDNVKLYLAEDVHFDRGTFEVKGNVEFYSGVESGQMQFVYEATNTSKVRPASKLHFDTNVIFRYAPGGGGLNQLTLENGTSILSLSGATLSVSSVGFQLTKGTLLIDHNCKMMTDGADLGQGIIFGDGTSSANDLYIDILPGGNIDAQAGLIEYKNVEG